MKKGLSLPADHKRTDKEHGRGRISEEENVYWEGRLKGKYSPHSNDIRVLLFGNITENNHDRKPDVNLT